MTYSLRDAARRTFWREPAIPVFAFGAIVAFTRGFSYTPTAGIWGGLTDGLSLLAAIIGVVLLGMRANASAWWGSAALLASGVAGLAGWLPAALGLAIAGALWAAFSGRGQDSSTHDQVPKTAPWLQFREAAADRAGAVYGTLATLLVLEIWKELAAPHRTDGHLIEIGIAATLLAIVGVLAASLAAGRGVEVPEWTQWSLRPGVGRRLAGIAAGCFALFLLFGGLILLAPVDTADAAWVHAFFRSGGRSVTDAMRTISRIGGNDLVVYGIPLVLILLSICRRGREVRFFAPVMFGTVGLEVLFKTLFHRARPAFGGRVHWDSFPSGHTLAATLLAVTLLLVLLPLCRRGPLKALLWVFAVTWPVLMGISRVYLGRHYVTDVIAAILLGIAWVLACQALYSWSFQRARVRRSPHRA